MSIRPIVYPPPIWVNQDIVLYHGTSAAFVPAIMAGVVVSLGKPGTDFGPGFYTTTSGLQANTWAAQIAASTLPPSSPAVIQFTVPRNALASLEGLAFVRGDFFADEYWSFVHYCRNGALDHGRVGAKLYDVIYGPVAAFWNQRSIIANADQVSFHTPTAEAVLNASLRKQII